MAAANVLDVQDTCVDEKPMDLDANQGEETFSDRSIESFIDEEFSNLFDSESSDVEESLFEVEEDTTCSNSSKILAQQLQKLNDSHCVDSGEPSRQTDVSLERNEAGESCSIATKEELKREATQMVQHCEKCSRLQSNNSSSLDSGIGDGHRDEAFTDRHVTAYNIVLTIKDVADVREVVVTDDQIVDILEEIGNIWKILGPILNIKSAKLKNIDADYQHNADKASCLLTAWKEQEGKSATVGNLESALLRIKRKDIADKFLEIVGISSCGVQPIQVIDKPLNLNIKVGLSTEYTEPGTSVSNMYSTVMAWHSHGMAQSWHGTVMAWHSHGMAQSWHGTVMARYSHGTVQSWHGTVMAQSWHGTVMAQYSHGTVMAWHSHGTIQSWPSHGTVMAWHSHGTIQSWHGTVMAWHSDGMVRTVMAWHSHGTIQSWHGTVIGQSWHGTVMAQYNHGTVMAWHSHGMAQSWHGTVMAWHSHGTIQSWHGTVMAWHSHGTVYSHGTVQSWHGTVMARYSHGMSHHGMAQSWHDTVMAWYSHGMAQSWHGIQSWHGTVMARYSHGTAQSWHGTVMAQYSHGTAQSWHGRVMAWHSHGTILLCEDATGKKYLVKEITDGQHDWNIEKIVDDEQILERMIVAARNSRKTKEERRQDSLRRVSAELTQLRERMKKVRLKSEDKDETGEDKDVTRPQSDYTTANMNKITLNEAREMLKMCVVQSENSQIMYRVLIKLIGEVGPLEGNSRCLRQLSDFTNELRDQERKLYPKLVLLDALKDNLDDNQVAILGRLQKWQQTQNKQVDGIEKLITSLLEQGNIRWHRKTSNRRSEPIFNKIISGNLGGRR
ncbi:hypothetical protein QZH41_013590, partial [Actinostola sp. cb2023]